MVISIEDMSVEEERDVKVKGEVYSFILLILEGYLLIKQVVIKIRFLEREEN